MSPVALPPVPTFPTRHDAVRLWRRLAPARVALVDRRTDRRLSYAALDALADRWAALLLAQGVEAGDRVAVLAGNRVEHVALFIACDRVGAALVPLNWRLAAAELAPIVENARPAVLFGEAALRGVAEAALASPALAGVRWIDLDHDAPALLARHGDEPVPARMHDPEEPLLVLYTSGTTGRPKGALLPRRQLFWNAVATTVGWEMGPHEVVPVTTPFFHTGAWNVFSTPVWQSGGTVVLFDRFEPGDFLEGMAAEGCTLAFGVPTQYLMLLEHARWGAPLPALRRFLSGGAPCPPSVAARVRAAGYGFREGFGLTECGPNCFAISDGEAVARPGSVGWPIPFLGMRLVDDDGRDVPDDAVGELLLRGPQLFGGYLHDPERTAEAFTADGWLRTGDLAVRDADGAHRIAGRRKEMYISGGENVFPAEVEAALADCPGVGEVVVVGVSDPRWGEVGRAFVQPRAGAALDPAQVVAFARTRLAGYKVPKSVVLLPELPRLGSGKADRGRLRELAAAAPSTVADAAGPSRGAFVPSI